MQQAVFPTPQVKKITAVYSYTALILFIVLALLGALMRWNQHTGSTISPDLFYAIMTLHGLGMVSTLYISGFAASWYLMSRYVQANLKVLWFIYVLVILGTVGLLCTTLIGRFGAGWYVLYPLPFIKTWPWWSLGGTIISLMLLGVAWLVGQLELIRAMAVKYGFGNLLGWQYFKKSENRTEIPPIVLITAVSLIAGIVATLSGAVMLMLYLFQWLIPTLKFDPLLLKNAVFLFGHTIVNITMYFGIAVVYELMPSFTGRPWKTNKAVVTAWNVTFILVLFAFFHHLYMDFVQPIALQYIGQLSSYFSVIPATVVTIFGAFAQVFRSGMKWKFTPLSFYFGLMGWVVGCFAAVVDSTILVNVHFHNTLWVPAHFHTYFLLGYVFILFGFIYYFREACAEKIAKFSLWTMVFSGYGFVLMFYLGGFFAVPRRYANYTSIPPQSVVQSGETTALIATIFAGVLIVGVLIYCYSLCTRKSAEVDG